MHSDLVVWIAPATTLIGVVLGAKLNGSRTERREDRKAILARRAELVAELDLQPMTTHIRMEEGRRDRVELMLLGTGLSSWAVWSFLRALEAHEKDQGSHAVDTDRRLVIPALAQRGNAYRQAAGALSSYLDGSMSRRRTQRVLVRAGNHVNTSRGQLTRRTRRWAEGQAGAFDRHLRFSARATTSGLPRLSRATHGRRLINRQNEVIPITTKAGLVRQQHLRADEGDNRSVLACGECEARQSQRRVCRRRHVSSRRFESLLLRQMSNQRHRDRNPIPE